MPAKTFAVLLIFSYGLIHIAAGSCRIVEKEVNEEGADEVPSGVWLPNRFHDWISGCKYRGVEMTPGKEIIFPDCEVCVCSDKSRLFCCSGTIPDPVPDHCEIVTVGCESRAVLKIDKTAPCDVPLTGKGR